jgi:hypothetical protein
MARPLKDPAKKAVQATVRLSPDAWAHIDELRAPGQTRASVIEEMVWRDAQQTFPGMGRESNIRSIQQRRQEVGDKLIDVLRADEPAPSAAPGLGNCAHPKWAPINGGMRRCLDCAAVRGTDGVWRLAR